jgi:hypothetical protein
MAINGLTSGCINIITAVSHASAASVNVGDRFVKTGQGARATFFGMHKRQPLVRCATSLEITDLGSLATNPASNHDSPPPPLSPTACGLVIYM